MRKLTRRQQLSALALAVVALLFISLDFTGGALGGARGGTTGALGSLYRGTDSVIGPVRRFVQAIPDVGRNRSEIAQLQQRNRQLSQQLAAATTDATTSHRLAALQLQADSERWQILPARVIATGPGAGFQWTLTLDAGSREHLQAGQSVTDGQNLVGRLIAVYPTTSVVLLSTDPTSAVGVRDARTGELLLAAGRGSAGLSARPLDEHADVRAGDRLVTGPAGQTTFAPGLEVGRVGSVHAGTDGSVTAQLQPSAGRGSLDLVGVVLLPVSVAARPALTPAANR
ncbi:MAG: rod shape-determining protein MreC [Jatrophihabitantaceae bacterium]